MLVIIAIHSGRTSAAGILNLVLMNSRSAQSVRYYKTSSFVDIVITISVVNSCEIHIFKIAHPRSRVEKNRDLYQSDKCFLQTHL